LTPLFHLTKWKTKIQHIDFPQSLLQKSLQKNYTHPFCDWLCRLNGLQQFFGVPKIRGFTLEKQNNKPIYKQNTNTDSWEELLVAFETSRTYHHSPFSSIIPSSKIDTLFFLSTLHNGLFLYFFQDRDLQTSLAQLLIHHSPTLPHFLHHNLPNHQKHTKIGT
jgi:hypothetical protein